MRTLFLSLAFAAVTPLLLLPRDAAAQITDSERQAARQLFNDGVALQTAGHYADALDKFTRAQKVIFAHTNLVHIGECQVQLGKWVEAAETYRLAIRTDTGGNPAFQAAQATSQSELNALQPRIPKLKIDVSPQGAPDLQVQVDGQQVNSALLDVPVPLDPGTHQVVAFAAGYTSAQQSVTLQERDAKSVALTLTPTGGVTYSSPGGPAPLPPPPPPPDSGTPGAVSTVPPPPPPPPDGAPHWTPARRRPNRGLLLGFGLGADIPTGDLDSDSSLSNFAKTGAALDLSAMFRFSKFGFGLFYQYASFGQGDTFAAAVAATPSTETLTTNAHSNYLGIMASYISNPQGVGFYGEVGFGYRIFSFSETFQETATGAQQESDRTFTAPELLLGAGVYIHAGTWLRLIPKVSIGLGSFTNASSSCTSSGLVFAGTCPANTSGSVNDTSGHAFFVIGLNGYYEVPL